MNQIKKWLISSLIFFSYGSIAATVDEGVTLFNQKDFKQAKVIFESLAKQGDDSAMFWLGITQFRTGEQFKAGETLLKSAEAGNPWAMLMMSPEDNGYCGYLGWPCDPSWRDKAFFTLEELAEQGNGNAICALLYRKGKPWWAYVPIYNKKRGEELAEKGVKDGWYGMASCGIPMEIKKQLELLEYAVNQNYAPAMVDLYYLQNKYNPKEGNSVDLLKKALKLGYLGGAFNLLDAVDQTYKTIDTVSDVEELSVDKVNNLEETYFYSLIVKNMGVANVGFFVTKYVRDENDERKNVTLISPKRQKEIEERADLFLNKIKQNLYLKESSTANELLGS